MLHYAILGLLCGIAGSHNIRGPDLSGSHHQMMMMASAQVVEMSVNTNNSSSQDYTTNPDDHSNHNIDSPGFKPFTVIMYSTKLRNTRY